MSIGAVRHLYAHEKISKNPRAKVLVLASSRGADVAQAMFRQEGIGEHQVVAVSCVDDADFGELEIWRTLAGRSIGLWPRASRRGINCMLALAATLQPLAARVKVIAPPAGVPDGWDLGGEPLHGLNVREHVRSAAMSVEAFRGQWGIDAYPSECGALATAPVMAAPIELADDGSPIYDDKDPVITASDMVARFWSRDGIRSIQHHNGEFLLWGGAHYEANADADIRATIYRHLARSKRWVRASKKDGPEFVMGPFKPNRNKVADVVDALRAVSNLAAGAAAPCWISGGVSRPPVNELLPCSNGLFHLPSGQLHPHSPDFFGMNSLPFPWLPTRAEPVAWQAFLRSLWPDDEQSISALQLMFGYLLTGDTSLQKIFLLVGPPRCGKGTILRVIQSLLGDRNICAPDLNALGERFALEGFIGKQAALVGDARISHRSDHAAIAAKLLSISGEDAISVDRKNRLPWVGRLNTRCVIVSNMVPTLNDASGALASRFVVFSIRPSFLGSEDQTLGARLQLEMAQILAWAVEGWRRLQVVRRIETPSAAMLDVRELDDLASPIRKFVREECHLDSADPKCWVNTGDLYRAWCMWCRENGREYPGTEQAFGRDLRGAVRGRVERKRYRARDGKLEDVDQDETDKPHEIRRYRYVGISLKIALPV